MVNSLPVTFPKNGPPSPKTIGIKQILLTLSNYTFALQSKPSIPSLIKASAKCSILSLSMPTKPLIPNTTNALLSSFAKAASFSSTIAYGTAKSSIPPTTNPILSPFALSMKPSITTHVSNPPSSPTPMAYTSFVNDKLIPPHSFLPPPPLTQFAIIYPMRIPPEKLSPDALAGLIEEFVSRDGTDLVDMDIKADQVRRALAAGHLFIAFDEISETVNILTPDEYALADQAYQAQLEADGDLDSYT